MFFKYCIWLTSNTNTVWDSYTNGFKAHMSIKTKFKYLYRAIQFFNSIVDQAPIKVELSGPLTTSEEHGFYAAYYNVKYSHENTLPEPKWWPKNAHVSFLYKYKIPIDSFEKKQLERKVKEKNMIFDKISIMKCDCHHNYWQNFSDPVS